MKYDIQCILFCLTDVFVSLTEGSWGQWAGWGECSEACGTGVSARNRSCDSPAPAQGGADCMGKDEELVQCNGTLCPISELAFCSCIL